MTCLNENILPNYTKIINLPTVNVLMSISTSAVKVLNHDQFKSLINLVLELMRKNNPEIVGPCLSFIKASTSIFNPIIVSDHLDDIMDGICHLNDSNQRRFRQKTRDIFSRFIRKFGGDRITALIPNNSTTLQKRIRALRKIEARKKKAKEQSKNNESESDSDDDNLKKSVMPASMDEILKELDTSDDDDDNEDNMNKKKSKKDNTKANKTKSKKNQTWIKEDEDEIVDFLDPAVNRKILSKKPTSSKISEKTPGTDEENSSMSNNFPIDKISGKLVITEPKNEKRKDKNELSIEDYDDYMHLKSGAQQGKIKKLKLNVDYESDNEEPPEKVKVNNNKTIQKKKKEYGAEYKAKKAKGDVKIKGKPDPYAYVTFHKDRLNRRKKTKYAGQLKTLVKGAKRGASKGAKLKNMKRK